MVRNLLKALPFVLILLFMSCNDSGDPDPLNQAFNQFANNEPSYPNTIVQALDSMSQKVYANMPTDIYDVPFGATFVEGGITGYTRTEPTSNYENQKWTLQYEATTELALVVEATLMDETNVSWDFILSGQACNIDAKNHSLVKGLVSRNGETGDVTIDYPQGSTADIPIGQSCCDCYTPRAVPVYDMAWDTRGYEVEYSMNSQGVLHYGNYITQGTVSADTLGGEFVYVFYDAGTSSDEKEEERKITVTWDRTNVSWSRLEKRNGETILEEDATWSFE